MSNETASRLNPTLWRTCRVLANKKRLAVLQAVLRSPGLSVTETADRFGMSVSLASRYLRELNARGLLKATRRGRDVRYWPHADPSVPQATVILEALATTFRRAKKPVEYIFWLVTAFTHPRRIAILRALAHGPIDFDRLRASTRMSGAALKRHVRKLSRRGLVCRREDTGFYVAADQESALGKVLVRMATR